MKYNTRTMLLLLSAFASLSLVGCGKATASSTDTLVVLNYGKYLDQTVIDMFEEETGIQIKLEEYESPEEMYTKYKAGSIAYDVACTSDYMVERLIGEGEVNPIQFDNFEYYGNIDPRIITMSQSFDPDGTYSLPYFYGTVGILYNTTMVDPTEVTSWNALWDENFADEIIMENSVRDSFIPALRQLGYSINTTDASELNEALQLLSQQKPLVYAYFVDEIGDEMAAGNAAMALAYSGEAAYATDINEDLAFSVPKEGSNLWIDSWFIPKSCTNQENAEKFLDFLCREDVAALNFDYVYYATPNTAVYDSLEEDIKNDTTIFPTDETIHNCEVFVCQDEETITLSNDLWKQLKSE